MAYIGIQPAEKFTSFATQEFSTSATTSYTLDHAVANENEIALFVNNVRQQPGSGKAYTATGTALTLSAATASTDTMYCVFLGRALQTVTPATNSITNAMITDNTIESGKLFSTFKNGITSADTWRLITDFSGGADPITNLEQNDDASFEVIGAPMSVSSGIFTFPETGKYLIHAVFQVYNTSSQTQGDIQYTVNNSSYSTGANCRSQMASTSYNSISTSMIFDVTSTTNCKVKFKASSGGTIMGNTSYNATHFQFIRIGST